MPRYINKPSLVDLASRRKQTIAQLVADWSINSLEELERRCQREGVKVPQGLTLSFVNGLEADGGVSDGAKSTANDPPRQENASALSKKSRKGKVTLDESPPGNEHVGVDPRLPPRLEDPT